MQKEKTKRWNTKIKNKRKGENVMGYKFRKTLKDNKKSIIIIVVLWVILSIVLVAPISYSIGEATNGRFF